MSPPATHPYTPTPLHPPTHPSKPPLYIQVVTACLRSGTDYIDLCGEPEFMDRMLLMYHEEAKSKGVRGERSVVCLFVCLSLFFFCFRLSESPPLTPPTPTPLQHNLSLSFLFFEILPHPPQQNNKTTPTTHHQVLIVSACAFDSVPADLGAIFTERVSVYVCMYVCMHMHIHIHPSMYLSTYLYISIIHTSSCAFFMRSTTAWPPLAHHQPPGLSRRRRQGHRLGGELPQHRHGWVFWCFWGGGFVRDGLDG